MSKYLPWLVAFFVMGLMSVGAWLVFLPKEDPIQQLDGIKGLGVIYFVGNTKHNNPYERAEFSLITYLPGGVDVTTTDGRRIRTSNYTIVWHKDPKTTSP